MMKVEKAKLSFLQLILFGIFCLVIGLLMTFILDFIPDAVPGVGYVDDVIILIITAGIIFFLGKNVYLGLKNTLNQLLGLFKKKK